MMTLGARTERFLGLVGRLFGRLWGVAIAVGGCLCLRQGYFTDLRAERADAGPIVALCLFGMWLCARLWARLAIAPSAPLRTAAQPAQKEAALARADVELGMALFVCADVILALTGGLSSRLYPLIYAVVAFAVTFHRRAVGLPLLFVGVALEWLLYRGTPFSEAAQMAFFSHVCFFGFFALLHLFLLQAELLRQRREHRLAVAGDIRRLRQEARDFRLISSSLTADPKLRSRESDEERLAVAAVETIHQTLFYTLELLKKSLDLHTAVLLWLDERGERLTIKELVSDSDAITEVSLPADAGALGTIVKNRLLVNLRDPKRSHLPYYNGNAADASADVDFFVGVPVLEDGHLRGVLCADRRGRAFGALDEALLQGAAGQILRTIQSERLFAAVERSKYEHERFFAALARLNRALGTEAVCATTFEGLAEICAFDFAAITLFDKNARRHRVVAAHGDQALVGKVTGLEFADNAGLVAMVVKNRHFLPAGGELRDPNILVFTKKVRLAGMESLLVLPLIAADQAVGAFTIAARRPRAFTKDKREMMMVVANHVAVSLSNAGMYGRMEEMATTDGLTGLVNHRTFQERVVEMLARAERSGGTQAVLLTDIDHFKKVNDTYGHPVGDQVLRKVAQVVSSCVRKIDLAARYGGEEFAVVLEGTDAEGARLLAERIRTEVQKLIFQSDKGPFSVTLSLGISVYPEDGRDSKTLIGRSDQALYHAKHNGRNRAVAWSETAAAGSPPLAAVR